MAWIESHQELGRHPKTRRLARLLGISAPAAVGHLHFLWWWALDFAQDGDLSRYDEHDIADAMEWEGDAHALVDALAQSGFCDRDERGLRLHDWYDYAGKLIERRAADAERKRRSRVNADGERNAQDVQRTSDGQRAESIRNPNPNHNHINTHAHCASVSDGYTEEFEQFWQAYPRKRDKKRAFRAWKARLKERDAPTPEQLILAAQNYAAECEAQGTAERYIKHGSTFLGPDKPYEEYLQPVRASPDEPPVFTEEEMAQFEAWLAEERAKDEEDELCHPQ